MPNVKQEIEYKNYSIKPADNFNKDFLVYKLINGNARFVKGFSSIEKAKTFIDESNKNKGDTMPKKKLNRLFKKIQKFDVIENDKVKHLFKITHLDNSTAVYDNDGNLVMKSTINKANNNKEKK